MPSRLDHSSIPRNAGYALSLPADTFVDRERAWGAIHHVRSTHRSGDLAGAFAEAVIAHEIAARGFLPGESGEWIEAERRLLRGIEVQALEAVVEAELDPLRESGYRLLMRSLAAAGNGAAAAEVMSECQQALATVGATPGLETDRVFRTVLRS